MKSTKIHSPLQTLAHNLTPPSLHVKLPRNNPLILIVSKFHPNLSYSIYIPLETHQPVKRRGRIDDMAIHSPHNSPFTDLNTI